MDFKRKISKELLDWKNSTGKKKALVIKGLRQIGKTYTVRKFAEENYNNVIYINFKNNSSIKSIFNGDFNVDRMILDLSAQMPGTKFVAGETILIFDEIQECSNARASIKSFMEDQRFDVIATGSLLGIKGYNKSSSKGIPTGFEHIIYMKPMDFEEFLWAKNISEDVIDNLKQCLQSKTKISDSIHNAMIRYFNEYICVGGLPYIVDRFISTNNMNIVLQEQKDIIEEYKDDFGKHLDKNENESINKSLLAKINSVFDSIPAQLAKENKKFTFTMLSNKGRLSEYQSAIQWLYDAGLINICYNLSNISRPLEGNKINGSFKIYMQDSGLFVSMLEEGTQAKILNNELGMYKGAIYENIIADSFSKLNKKLFYYKKESGLEIDFVGLYNGDTVLYEVKASNGNTKSTSTVLKNQQYEVNKCIKLCADNISETNSILRIPYYLAFLLND